MEKFYGIIIVTIFFLSAAHAQIVYTDVNPDTTIKNASYALDLNNDGITDFVLGGSDSKIRCRCWNSVSGGPSKQAYISVRNSNEIVDTDDAISCLHFNTMIDSSPNWGSFPSLLASNGGTCFPCGHAQGDSYVSGGPKGLWSDKNGYIGLRSKAGSNIYYGWASVHVGLDGSSIIIHDYSYNSIPNQPICAGETSCTTPTVTLHANGPLSFCAGDSVTLTAKGTGYLYQWKKDGTNIKEATSKKYVVKTGGIYKCKVTNSYGSITSKADTVTITCKGFSNASANKFSQVYLQVAPNPFSTSTTISFSIRQAQRVSVQIFDNNGVLIKVLADEEMQAGAHQLVWNARDLNGNAAQAGIYLLKVQAGNYTETRKLVVVK